MNNSSGRKKQVRMANHSNNTKSGKECKEGLGRPVKPKKEDNRFPTFAELYLEDYEKENAYGCGGYMMYDFDNSQYCCSSRPRTPIEMLEFVFMLLDSVAKTNKTVHLRTIDYYFRALMKKIPEELINIKEAIKERYDNYVEIIEEEYKEFKQAVDAPLTEEEQEIMDEFDKEQEEKESRANANYEKMQNFLGSQKRNIEA